MRLFFTVLLLGIFQFSFAWQNDENYHFQVPINPSIVAFDSAVKIDQMIRLNSQGIFNQAEPLGIANRTKEYWLKVDFSPFLEILNQNDSIYIYPGNLEVSTLYFFPNGTVDSLNLTRLIQNDLHRATLHSLEFVKVSTHDLLADSSFFIKAKFLRATPDLDTKTIRFSDPKSHEIFSRFIGENSFKSQVLAFFFLGVAAVLTVFNVILFFYMRERQYLYYGIFLLFQLIYYSQLSPYLASVFGYNKLYFFYWLTTVSQLSINLFYTLFVRNFLDLSNHLPKFDKFVLFNAWLLAVLILVNSYLIFLEPYSIFQSQLMDFQRYYMAGFSFIGIGYLWVKYPNKLKYFVIAATLIFTTGALMTMFLMSLDYMVAGSSIECTIFALGLSYKIKLISQQKIQVEKEAFQTKLGALRAQINPHFIFNSLSSIQHLISSGQKEAALSYLSKFSKFVRQVLENSIDVHVTLEKEIELLKVYLDLESLRFDHAFSYKIETPSDFDLSFYEVPMLIVQPFVENAIKHGLMPKRVGERRVVVRFFEEEKAIRCEIEDNGIGRKASAELKKTDYRPSRGMSLTEERLKLINREKQPQIQLDDLVEGTRVTIKLSKQ
ncbi:histidine kinase [Algoriphagus sp.]|uniref:sensor histidine kinase n=1 Tax=Algoriphagus sp. TaxID=1872435 RepID=UPI0025EACC52|nr:histidine kinase [Algoriphagus sp.]